jgi:hypothetical protein
MKNSKKIKREQLKEIKGGILPGMKKCYDEVTCEIRIYYAVAILNSPCASDLPVCISQQD